MESNIPTENQKMELNELNTFSEIYDYNFNDPKNIQKLDAYIFDIKWFWQL